jgi:hypothetical protein
LYRLMVVNSSYYDATALVGQGLLIVADSHTQTHHTQ